MIMLSDVSFFNLSSNGSKIVLNSNIRRGGEADHIKDQIVEEVKLVILE